MVQGVCRTIFNLIHPTPTWAQNSSPCSWAALPTMWGPIFGTCRCVLGRRVQCMSARVANSVAFGCASCVLLRVQDEAIACTTRPEWASVASTLNSEVVCMWSEDRFVSAGWREGRSSREAAG